MRFICIVLFVFTAILTEGREQILGESKTFAELENVPVFYEGRIRPFDAFARLWMQAVYHRHDLLPEHRQFFPSSINSPVDFLWSLNSFDATKLPMFWLDEKELKKTLLLNESKDRFCFEELRHVFENVLSINL